MSIALSWTGRGIIYEMSGQISREEVTATDERIYGDSRFDNIHFFIIDASRVSAIDITQDDLMLVAAIDKSTAGYNPFMRMAIVANDAALRTMFETYIEKSAEFGSPWKFGLFDCMDDAEAWAIK